MRFLFILPYFCLLPHVKILRQQFITSRECVNSMEEEIARLTRILASAGSNAVNLAQLLNVCTTNALSRAMIRRRLFNDSGAGWNPRADEFKSMVVEVMVLAGIFNIGDFIPALEFLDLQGVQAKMKKLHKRFDEFLTSITEEHKVGKTEKHNDILSTLLSLKDVQDEGGTRLTDTEIKALLLNLFTTGTDMSSSTTEWAIAKLIHHPRMMAQVQQDLDAAVGRDRLMTELD